MELPFASLASDAFAAIHNGPSGVCAQGSPTKRAFQERIILFCITKSVLLKTLIMSVILVQTKISRKYALAVHRHISYGIGNNEI